MTHIQQKFMIGLTALIAAVAGFTVTGNLWAARENALANWLKLDDATASKLDNADATFAADQTQLQQTLSEQRDQLSRIMADTASSDQQILSQVEQVIAAHNALERRVARHLVAVRSMLTPDQQKQLMSLCSDAVKDGGQSRWRHGKNSEGGERGNGKGPGQGQGRHGQGGGGGQ